MGKTIGLVGCLTSNENMGCSALTYTLLQLLENRMSDNSNRYVIFDLEYSEDRVMKMCEELKIDRSRIIMTTIAEINLHRLKHIIKTIVYYRKIIKMRRELKMCDVVIDMTSGDSFTDIYGKDRFYILSSIKKTIEKLRIPLILGPQTYGPFENGKCKKFAKGIIEKAKLVVSRDATSKQYVESFCDANVNTATDLAFKLKYDKQSNHGSRIKVGVNVSGLLHSSRTDFSGFQANQMKTNYDEYTNKLLDYLTEHLDKYEVVLIPHVGVDANKAFENTKGIKIHEPFMSPIEAKSFISGMDIFIGARMHATIAAFSTGVATIPVAYSRKFSGLYNNVDYPYIVDLIENDTETNIQYTIECINNYKKLQETSNKAMQKINEKYKINETVMMDAVFDDE